jgi:Tfp pilus assembly protein PilN
MIRINLIKKERKEGRRPKIEFAPSEMTKQLAFVALFVLTFAVAAFFWFDLQGRKSALESDIAEATRERDRLKSIKELVDRLEKERNRLAQRLQVLNDLKNNLRTPLHPVFFIYVAQQENADVLITEISQNSGNVNDITIIGQASQENLNKFSETLMSEPLVQTVNIISQVGNRFQVVASFVPFNSFNAGTDGQTAAAGGGGQ